MFTAAIVGAIAGPAAFVQHLENNPPATPLHNPNAPPNQSSSSKSWNEHCKTQNPHSKSAVIANLVENREAVTQQQKQITTWSPPFTAIFTQDEVSGILARPNGYEDMQAINKYSASLLEIQNHLHLQTGLNGESIRELLLPFAVPKTTLKQASSEQLTSISNQMNWLYETVLKSNAHFTSKEQAAILSHQNGFNCQQMATICMERLIPLQNHLHQNRGATPDESFTFLSGLKLSKDKIIESPLSQLNFLGNTLIPKLLELLKASDATFTIGEQFNILSNEGGLRSLQEANAYILAQNEQHALVKQEGYTQEQINNWILPVTLTKNEVITITSQSNGWEKLQAVKNCMEYVISLRDHLHSRRRLTMNETFQSISALNINKEKLMGFSADQLEFAKRDIYKLLQTFDASDANFTIDEQVSMITRGNSLQSLQEANDYLLIQQEQRTTLSQQGYTPAEIDNLLQPIVFTKNEVISMVSHINGGQNLDSAKVYMQHLMKYREDLHEKGGVPLAQIDNMFTTFAFTKNEAARIASQDNGGQKLRMGALYIMSLLPTLRRELLHKSYPTPQVNQWLTPIVFNKNRMMNFSLEDLQAITTQINTLIGVVRTQGNNREMIENLFTQAANP